MSFENDFLDCMPSSIGFKAPDGTFTDRGKPNLGASTTFTARIVEANVVIRNDEGEERMAGVTIYLPTSTVFDPAGELTLPVGFTPRNPPILEVSRYPDQDGTHHTRMRVAASGSRQ